MLTLVEVLSLPFQSLSKTVKIRLKLSGYKINLTVSRGRAVMVYRYNPLKGFDRNSPYTGIYQPATDQFFIDNLSCVLQNMFSKGCFLVQWNYDFTRTKIIES